VKQSAEVSPLRAAARVAAYATLIALLLYVAAAGVVMLLLTQNLTQAVDDQLGERYQTLASRSLRAGSPVPPDFVGRPGGSFGPLYQWVMDENANVLLVTEGEPDLPVKYRHVGAPTTARLGSQEVRLMGGASRSGYLVVGEDLSFLAQSRRSLLISEGAALIPFLAVVFLAALLIGRNSAAPIENARRRLLAFTADASHELRTPLQVIEAETSLALRKKRAAESYRETIERIADESGRLRNLVEDLLWLARFDNQNRPAATGAVDLAAAAAGAVQRFESVAARREQRLGLSLVDGPAPIVNVPETWVDRLFGVLLDNACRYTPDGGAIEVQIRVSGGRVQLRVDDNGPGIPPAERTAIFERFHRATSEGGGSGLGLAIGNAIVQATRGRWEVGDSPAGGASISVWWPLAREARTLPAPRPLAQPAEDAGA